MSTWQELAKAACGDRGYEVAMRRSLQTVLLFEAVRCLGPKLPALRPFQRKAVYMDQVHILLESLDFLDPTQKSELLWRTASSKEEMDSEIAWKRAKTIQKDLEGLQMKIRPIVPRASTHEEAVQMLVQSLYEKLTGFSGKPYPEHWEHAHNHVVMAYRMYYHLDELDPSFPEPCSPREPNIPIDRPKSKMQSRMSTGSCTVVGEDDEPHLDVAELLGEKKSLLEDRRKVMQEVREHLDLLKEFEGVICEEDLAKRKRELFLALPGAPPAMVPLPSMDSLSAKKLREN